MKTKKILKKILIEPMRYGILILNYINAMKIKETESGYVVVAPSLTLTGAPLLSYEIAKSIHKKNDVVIIAMSGGELKKTVRKKITIINLASLGENKISRRIIALLCKKGYKRYICNSIVGTVLLPSIKHNNAKTVVLIHEMKEVIKRLDLDKKIDLIIDNSKNIIFPAEIVMKDFKSMSNSNFGALIYKQGLYNISIIRNYQKKDSIRREKRLEIGLDDDDFVVMGSGTDWRRKGFDYFAELSYLNNNKKIKFIWVGDVSGFNNSKVKKVKVFKKISHKEIYKFFLCSDVFFLSSREDPFPSVVLEAMAAGMPVIAFKNTGGAEEIIQPENGLVIEQGDITGVAKFLERIYWDKVLYNDISQRNKNKIENEFVFDKYVELILDLFK